MTQQNTDKSKHDATRAPRAQEVRKSSIAENAYGSAAECEKNIETKNLNLKPAKSIKIHKVNSGMIKRISQFKEKCTTPSFALEQETKVERRQSKFISEQKEIQHLVKNSEMKLVTSTDLKNSRFGRTIIKPVGLFNLTVGQINEFLSLI